MKPSFQIYINEVAIPQNWKTLSKRFDIQSWTYANQRMKIIGEIVEFYEALELYKTVPTPLGFSDVTDELADIIISCCTLISLQGDGREFNYIPVNHEEFPLEWIRMVCTRRTNLLISSVANYGQKIGIDVEEAVTRKIKYNMKRTDW